MAQYSRLLALTPLLLAAAAGCVITPVGSQELRSAQIGRDSKAPVRVGVTTRDETLGILGKPNYSTQHDAAMGYLFAVKTGTARGLLVGPCTPYIGSADVYDDDDVWLEFDGQGVLKRVEKQLIKRHHHDMEAAWRAFAKSVPDPIRPEQMLNGRP